MNFQRIWPASPVSQPARRPFSGLAERVSSLVMDFRNYLSSEMKYVPGGWPAHSAASAGWSDQRVAEAQEKHWPTLVRNLEGTGPLGVAHFPWSLTREDRIHHNVMMSYGYVLARAARKKDRLSILDWGGGAGHYYLYSKALLPEVAIEYHCFDVPGLCKLGRKLLPEVQFHDDDSSLEGKVFDLVVSSSSLHYFENWRQIVHKLASASRGFLYIARSQTVFHAPSFVAAHKPNREDYAPFLCWCLNRQEVVGCAEQWGMELLREFVYARKWSIRGAPEQAETRGFLFRRTDAREISANEKG
jgi:putative methyltransferase (TIGR04325 family)